MRVGFHEPVRSNDCWTDDDGHSRRPVNGRIDIIVDVPPLGKPRFVKIDAEQIGHTDDQGVWHFERYVEYGSACETLARDAVATWKYRPLTRSGFPATARLSERLWIYRTEERPPEHVPFPPITSTSKVTITLDRSACWGNCPSYRVEVHEDGNVAFWGRNGTPFIGLKKLTAPAGKFSALLSNFRKADFYSLRSEYSHIPDAADYTLSIEIDGRRKSVVESDGMFEGMPTAVRRLQRDVDSMAEEFSGIRKHQAGLFYNGPY